MTVTQSLVIKYLDPNNSGYTLIYGAAGVTDISEINKLAGALVPAGIPFDIITRAEAEYPQTLELAKAKAIISCQETFNLSNNATVSYLTFNFQSGYDSAMKLDAAKRFAELSNQQSITVFDVLNVGHNLSILELQELIMLIANKYQIDLTVKNAKLVAINNSVTIADALAV